MYVCISTNTLFLGCRWLEPPGPGRHGPALRQHHCGRRRLQPGYREAAHHQGGHPAPLHPLPPPSPEIIAQPLDHCT